MSLVTCHLYYLVLFSYLVEGLLSTGPPRLDFFMFKLKTCSYPSVLIPACSGPFLVKLVRIKFQRHWYRLKVPKMANYGGRRHGHLLTFAKVRRCEKYKLFLA